MKYFFAIMLIFFSYLANAESGSGKCPSFFDGIDKAPYDKAEMIKILNKDQGSRDYLRIMKAEIVGVQDTGERFRCLCYNYLIKYKSKEDGHVWIGPVEIRNGGVYSPTAKNPISSTEGAP